MTARLSRLCIIAECESPQWSRQMCRKHYARWQKHGDPNKVLVRQSAAGAPMAFLTGLATQGEGCVHWPFSINNAGYAQIDMKGRKRLVSRILCERVHGPAPTSTHVAAHSCGNGHLACVAAWHLNWKTQSENMADAKAHGTFCEGERAPWSKLSADEVREIRGLIGQISQERIAARYGVTQSMISRIARGFAWGSV